MKKILHKRWHSIPVGIISAVMVVCLVAGGVLAAYNFFTATVNVVVEEAIFPSYGWNDDLDPYMVGGGVLPLIVADPLAFKDTSGFAVTFTISEISGTDGSEFCPGEAVVLPFNLRNRGDADITVYTTYTGGGGTTGVTLEYAWETNNSGGTYKATGTWDDLSKFSTKLPAHGGSFGSAEIGADVLFIKVTAAEDAKPGTYNFVVTFKRG